MFTYNHLMHNFVLMHLNMTDFQVGLKIMQKLEPKIMQTFLITSREMFI